MHLYIYIYTLFPPPPKTCSKRLRKASFSSSEDEPTFEAQGGEVRKERRTEGREGGRKGCQEGRTKRKNETEGRKGGREEVYRKRERRGMRGGTE